MGLPAFIDGAIYILLVDFDEKVINLFKCSFDLNEIHVRAEIPFHDIKDCYNLNVNGSPVMITCQGADHVFQILWPDKVEFAISERESFLYRIGDSMYFSEWHEDEEYREEINIRELSTGNLIDKIEGTFFYRKIMWIG